MKQNDWTSKLHERLADQEATVPDNCTPKDRTYHSTGIVGCGISGCNSDGGTAT